MWPPEIFLHFFFLSLTSFQTKKSMKKTHLLAPPPSSSPSLPPCFQDWDYLKRPRVHAVAKLGRQVTGGWGCKSWGPQKGDEMK